MYVVLKKNNYETRNRLANEGFILCKCCEDQDYGCLTFSSDSGYYEIHGVDMGNDKDFGEDVEGFINYCKELKSLKSQRNTSL